MVKTFISKDKPARFGLTKSYLPTGKRQQLYLE